MAIDTTSKVIPIVFVLDNEDEEGPYVVVPGKQLAQPGAHVRFQNCTDVEIKVTFADESLFGIKDLILAPKGKEHVTVNDVISGAYAYQADCGPDATPAHGSRPIIIIYDN